ncbi:MAG: general secretion pathway protein GspK [Desulfobacteraceae bacterium]|nr:general secretion pathway protein GspK [Desulfobacteraceae bacterium]
MRKLKTPTARNILNIIGKKIITLMNRHIFFAPLKNNRGVALLVTVGIITIMIAAGMQINQKMTLAATRAATIRDRLNAYEMAVSGVHGAMALLLKDKKETTADSLQEEWADPEYLKSMVEEFGFENGGLEIIISDELSKIQINALVQFPEGRNFDETQLAFWERFANRMMLLYEEVEDTDAVTIIHTVKDWLDSGDDDAITGLSGAESDYYEGLDPPYACKNGPFTHLGEVVLVKGITPEIFYGFGEILGFSNYITIHGMSETEEKKLTYPGKININTAPLPVVAALLPSDSEGFAQALIDYREDKSDEKFVNELTDEKWYKNIPGFGSIDISPGLIQVSSDVFRIRSTATVNDVKLTIKAVVQREKNEKNEKWQCKVLNWQA